MPDGRDLTFHGPRAATEGPRRAGGKPLPPRPPYRMWSFAYNITAPVNCFEESTVGQVDPTVTLEKQLLNMIGNLV